MTDQALLTELQYAVLEPPDGGASWPSEVWTRDEVLDALNAGARELARSTHLLTLRTEIPVLAGALTVDLPVDWIASAHLVWRTLAGSRIPLGPVDAFESDSAIPGWETTLGQPIGYADLDTTTLTLRLVPTPDANGTLELLYTPRPAEVNGSGQTLPFADELASGIKYSALSTMLSKVGRMQDPDRASYCDDRVQLVETALTLLLTGWA